MLKILSQENNVYIFECHLCFDETVKIYIFFLLILDKLLFFTFNSCHQYTYLKTQCTQILMLYCLISEFRQFFPQLTGILTLAFFIHNCIITLMKSNKHQENNVSLLNLCCLSLKLFYLFILVK